MVIIPINQYDELKAGECLRPISCMAIAKVIKQ
ncbi:hypothetical protein HDG70_002351 [Carboxydothermus ferrireducens DSM 11255]|uniref:Uncharacterized protein n=1 Tax=Carboxydothermus ferrireducens DSM 11255 TaxID=1119529 RepID=A0ABX2RFG3_9THEO|nr:hypothetical protein [Carboxydothermus ferrireducens DSM 11255]